VRRYRAWRQDDERPDGGAAVAKSGGAAGVVDFDTGLIAVKRALNELHSKLAVEGFDEVATEVIDDDVVLVTRRCASTQRSVVTVAHTAFRRRDHPHAAARLRSVDVPGVVDGVCLEASVVGWSSDYDEHDQLIVGLTDYRVQTRVGVSVADSRHVRVVRGDAGGGGRDSVQLVDFTPGCAVVLAVSLTSDAVRLLDELLRHFDAWIWARPSASTLDRILTEFDRGGDDSSAGAGVVFLQLVTVVSRLSQTECEHVLFQTEAERRPSGDGFTVYHVPGHGDLTYCGLAGVASLLLDMRRQHADPGRCPLGVNLLEGDWLMDYVVSRLAASPGTVHQLSGWFQHVFDLVKTLPHCLVPCYFEAVVSAVHVLVSTKM